MREILFRGKTTGMEWIEGFPMVFTENCVQICRPMEHSRIVFPETIGQYTGLTDKNGKKIFEGDIVKVGDEFDEDDFEVGVVTFCRGTFDGGFYEYNGWVCKDVRGDVDHKSLVIHDFEYIEIIGNIHDNPELLEGDNE